MVLSHATTQFPNEPQKVWDCDSPEWQMIYFMDISRAYFDAKVDESDPVYVEIPPEIDAAPGSCAMLKRHMYGARRAADGWQSEYSGSLIDMGVTQVTSSACVLRHDERQFMVSVHGDDFTCSGARPQLHWLETEMRSKYEPTVGARLGPGKDDDHEGLVLNRVVRWTSQGIVYEAEPRQVEKLIRDTQLRGANAVTMPARSQCRTSSSRSSRCQCLTSRGSGARRAAQITWGLIGQTSFTRPRKLVEVCRRPQTSIRRPSSVW